MRNVVNSASAVFGLILLAGVAATGSAYARPASSYPTRDITAIVPFSSGGATDFIARIVAAKLNQVLGHQIVIVNHPGAAGRLGVALAVRSKPDGYTVLFGNIGTMAINPSVFPSFHVKPLRDLIGVSVLSDMTIGLAISPSVPATTLKQLIAYGRKRPNPLDYSSSGPSSASRLALAFIMRKAGVKVVQVPYKGGGAATAAVVKGECQMTMETISSFIPFVKAGKLRVLGVMASHRAPQLPEVPTLAEEGFPELKFGSWQGLYVPKGTPRAIVNRLFAAVTQVMKDPDIAKRYRAAGVVVTVSKSPAAFAAFQRQQTRFWTKLVHEMGAVQK